MRYRSALLLAFLCSTAVAQSPGDVTVVVTSDHHTPSAVAISMQQEVDALVAPSGLTISWQSSATTGIHRQLAVIHLRGECKSESLPGILKTNAEALGQTQVIDGKVL